MRPRFSIKWLLVVMAYVALAAAAFVDDTLRLSNFLWAVTMTAYCYAILAACASPSVRGVALGFVVFFTANLVALRLAHELAVSSQTVALADLEIMPNGQIRDVQRLRVAGQPMVQRRLVAGSHVGRSAHAIGCVAAGLAGMAAGALAFRGKEQDTSDDAT